MGVIAFLSLLGFALLQTSDRFAKGVATYFLTVAEVGTKSLDEVKAELSNSLRSLARPMLVVIDDVDRLTGPETRLLFQLIKANADFPNMIYLVLFQREAVEAVLTRELSADGRGYLKKIVQVAFDVPNLQRSKLEAILFSKLDALLRGEAILKLWDQDRWTEVFIPGIGPYFMTLRDVYRFVSMLSLQFAVFSRKDAFEVNPIDLIALEVLRVFEPEVYKALSASKETLTKTEGFRSSPTREDAAEKEEIHGIIKKATEGRQESVKEILTQVFPPASWALNGSRDSSDRADAWYREHRACHPHVFDKYFQLSISEDDLSHEEIERIIALAGDRQSIVNQLRAIGKRNLLGVAMDRLDSYKETISLDHAVPFLTGIFDIGDELPVGQGGMTSIAPDMHAARIVYWYLKREPSVQKRQAILGECIAQTTGIYLSAFVVALEGDRAKEKREQESRLADDAGVKHLQDLCVSKIRDAAMIGTLAEQPRLGQLLGLWQAWASLDEVRNWVRSLVDTPGGLLSFLVVCLREIKSYGLSCYRARSYWDIDLDAIDKLVPLELIERKLAELTGETLEGKARQAVDAFHEALKRKREGKPKRSIIDFE